MKTYKLKHGRDFARELTAASKVAQYAIANPYALSTKYVKHLGLKAMVSNYILRKYGRNRTIKSVRHVKLGVPGIFTRLDGRLLYVPCLRLTIDLSYIPAFKKVCQVEFGDTYAYVTVDVDMKATYEPAGSLGVDRNTTKHCAVAADTVTGNVLMLGKSAQHIRTSYKNSRSHWQRKGKFKMLKKVKTREADKVKDLNHKISRKLVDYAYQNRLEIKLENLKGIRKTAKQRKVFRHSLHSWSYYQLQTFLEYKAKELGVPVAYVAPQYTSKTCSRCGLIGTRVGKLFKCPSGHVAHADINAAFNIGMRAVGDYVQK